MKRWFIKTFFFEFRYMYEEQSNKIELIVFQERQKKSFHKYDWNSNKI